MITQSQILSVADKIAQQFRPERIILFGSYAYGTPTEDSDVDLLIVMPLPNKGRGRASDIRLHLEVAFPLDLVICDPEYIAQRIEMNDFFLQEITKKGEVLYAGDNPKVDRQSGRRLGQRKP
jgi:predicted nucleotidyltransferase